MDHKLKIPPENKDLLTSLQGLSEKLKKLVGREFQLTGKSRTDGSNVRKLVGATLLSDAPPPVAEDKTYVVVPPKGVPKILLEYIDTYIVTTGEKYNLQVWNRNPSSESVQVQYVNGATLKSNEVRFVLAKINPEKNIISSIAILTPSYIVEKFGEFGKPTIKNQLIISNLARTSIVGSAGKILFYDDIDDVGDASNVDNLANFSIHDEPTSQSLLPLSTLKNIIIDNILNRSIAAAATKNRGQKLEELIVGALGYTLSDEELLAGGYPDIRNQALEVKIQDSPTVDLGKYSPEFEVVVPKCSGFTTRNMRYLIALTNPETSLVEGVVLCPGSKLGGHFTYVARESYKCQRSIDMSFFDDIQGQCVFDP